MSNLVVKNRNRGNSNLNTFTTPTLSSLIDDLFNREMPSVFSSNFNEGITLPKVNIREFADAYFVEVAVPGLKKSDFNINLDNKTLSISTEISEENEQKEENYTRREFGYSSFRRTFSLPETVEEDKIKAKYNDGILSIHLPKKEEARQKPSRTIQIS